MIPEWYWRIWLCYVAVGTLIAIVSFAVPEGIAIKDTSWTLSEFVWHKHVPAAIFFLGMGLITFGGLWLMLHFVSGGKWGL